MKPAATLRILICLLAVVYGVFPFSESQCQDAASLYLKGIEAFHLESWAEALGLFEEALKAAPDAGFGADATFKAAECRYRMGDLESALAGFRDYIARYPMGPNRGAAELRIASIQRELGGASMTPPTVPGEAGVLRAVRIDLIRAADWPTFEAELLRLRQCGFNAVIVRVYQAPTLPRHALFPEGLESGVYFPTRRAPVVGDLTTDLVRICHKYGLRVFALMTTKESDWAAAVDPSLSGWAWDLAGGRAVRVRGLDLFNDRALAYLEGLYEDLGATGVDGVLLADDLALQATEGFGPEGLALYEREFDEPLDPAGCFLEVSQDPGGRRHVGKYSEQFQRFSGLKCRRIVYVAAACGGAARRRNPGCLTAVTLTPFCLMDAGQAAGNYGHDFSLASAADLDYLMIPMHHRGLQRDLALTGDQTFSLMRRVTALAADQAMRPHRVVIEVQAVDQDSLRPIPDWEMEAALLAVLTNRGVSLALSPYIPKLEWEDIGRMVAAEVRKDNDEE